MANLKVLGNQGVYKGIFAKPIFEVVGDKASVRRQIYDAFHVFGFGVGDLRFDYNLPLAEQYVAVQFNHGHLKFLVERLEVSLIDFTSKDLQDLPGYLDAAEKLLLTLSPELAFTNYQFMYYGHVETEGIRPVEFFSRLPSPALKSAGTSLGAGFNFLWDVPEKKWRSRLALDHSLLFPNALFVGLTVEMQGIKILYAPTLQDVQSYLRTVLAELDLHLPIQ